MQKWAKEHGFLAVVTEVNEHYGKIELDYSDLFLLAAVVVESAMADVGLALPTEKLRTVLSWFQETILEDTQERHSELEVEVGGQLGGNLPLSLGKLFAKLTARFKGTSAHSSKTRNTLRKYPDTLIGFMNDLLKSANEDLIEHGFSGGLLLIFDNLDRYDPTNIDTILVGSSQQMRQLACHALFTFPISLAYKPITGSVHKEYSLDVVLPMMALRSRSEHWERTVENSVFRSENVQKLREALEQRVVIDQIFVNPEDADLLIKMSGGAIRDLIQLVTSAAIYTEDETRITTEAVLQAIAELRRTYTRFLTTEPQDYLCLAAYAKRKSMVTPDQNYGDQINRLLFNGCLLEYMEDQQTWHDVHPVLIETEEFRHACLTHDKPHS